MMTIDNNNYTFDTERLSDYYKDTYGFRPDYEYMKAWHNYQDDFKQVVWDRILVDLARAVEENKQYQAMKDDSHD